MSGMSHEVDDTDMTVEDFDAAFAVSDRVEVMTRRPAGAVLGAPLTWGAAVSYDRSYGAGASPQPAREFVNH